VAAALLFGQENIFITMVIGVLFDQAVVYHKISGYVALITGILHTSAYFMVTGHDDGCVCNDERRLDREVSNIGVDQMIITIHKEETQQQVSPALALNLKQQALFPNKISSQQV
jgi:hypothetical protein